MAARLTRAKKRIAGSGTGIELPDDLAVEERMPAVRRTIHLAYAMGHTAGSGRELRNDDVTAHALRLARAAARPASRRHRGRRPAGADPAHRGQGRHAPRPPTARRCCWPTPIATAGTGPSDAEGLALVADLRAVLRDRPDRADLQGHNAGVLVLHAAIAAEHARAATFADTDWAAIVRLLRRPADDRAEPDDRPRPLRRPVLPHRPGGRAGRRRRGHRRRWSRRATPTPTRPGPRCSSASVGPPTPRRRGRTPRRAPAPTPSERSSPTRA